MQGFSRASPADDIQRVTIVGVDPERRTATGMTRFNTTVSVDTGFAAGAVLVVPAIGEYWYIQRIEAVWRLLTRIAVNDPTRLIEPAPGQVSIGGTGPLELNGSTVNVRADTMRVGEAELRGRGGTLECNAGTAAAPDWQPLADWTHVGSDGHTYTARQMLTTVFEYWLTHLAGP